MSEATLTAAKEINEVLKSNGFDPPYLSEHWDTAMPKLAAFIKWADQELREEEFVVGAEFQLEREREETEEFVGYHYSNQTIMAPLDEKTLRIMGPAMKLGLGLAIFSISAERQGGKAVICGGAVADEQQGGIRIETYAHVLPKRGGLTEDFRVYEKRTLERLGWRKAEMDDGWIFEMPREISDPREEAANVEEKTETMDRANPVEM